MSPKVNSTFLASPQVLDRLPVSDQPRVVAVPVRRDLKRDKGEGAPLVDRND